MIWDGTIVSTDDMGGLIRSDYPISGVWHYARFQNKKKKPETFPARSGTRVRFDIRSIYDTDLPLIGPNQERGCLADDVWLHPDQSSKAPAQPVKQTGDRLADTYTAELGTIDSTGDNGGTIQADRTFNGVKISVPFHWSRCGLEQPLQVIGQRVTFEIERREARNVKLHTAPESVLASLPGSPAFV